MSGLNEQEREDLVAYLDGELDDERARALESRINVDPKARSEAEAMRQAWDMLDYLPRPEPSSNFTHRTLERLAIGHLHSASKRRRSLRWLSGLAWVAAVLLAAGGGFALAGKLWRPAPVPVSAPVADSAEVEDTLIHHLRVVQNRHLYQAADDLDFLRTLDQPELFGSEPGS
jgi:anti-sigma factor RsiW